MNEANAKLVESYATGGERVAQAVAGWSDADMLRLPSESVASQAGKWSVHQLIIHLQDGELSFADRIRRTIAMKEPALLAWNEGDFLEKLHYEDQAAKDAIDLIHLTRAQVSRILRKLSDSDFERFGIHSHRGPQKLSAIIAFADWHLNHHLEFVDKKRAAFK